MRPTWTEISLSALCQNYSTIQNVIGPKVGICAVVKSDAYGHGAIECARALEKSGASWFGVTSTEEGVRLRKNGINGRILLMTGYWKGEEEDVIVNHLTPAVWEPWHIEALEAAAKRINAKKIPIHLKVNTGMTRLGVDAKHIARVLSVVRNAPSLQLEGVFTHLASAEVVDDPDAAKQIVTFIALRDRSARWPIHPSVWHMANSVAAIVRPKTRLDMVRAGILLYGYTLPISSNGKGQKTPRTVRFHPVLSWKTRIIALRRVREGQRIGYGGTYLTRKRSKLALLPVGYGDGLSRQLSSAGKVLIHGSYAPIVGRVAMDLTVVDVTRIPGAKTGDEVILIGNSGRRSVTAWDVAKRCNTIPYEVLCAIGKRVRRVYVK